MSRRARFSIGTPCMRPRRLRLCRQHLWRWLGLALALLVAVTASGSPAGAVTKAEAQKPPLHIAIFMSSRNDLCYDRGDVRAIKRLTRAEQERINNRGGIAGRRLVLDFFDDEADNQRAVANMRAALADPFSLAMVGVSTSKIAEAVFDAAGDEIMEKKVPLISSIALDRLFTNYPHVFSAMPAQTEAWIPVITEFMKRNGVSRPAFIGVDKATNPFSPALGDGLSKSLEGRSFVADHRLHLSDEKLDPAAVASAIDDLKQKNPDLVFLAVFGNRPGDVSQPEFIIKELRAANVTPPIFLLNRLDLMSPQTLDTYPNDFYQLSLDRFPDITNDRLRRRVAASKPRDWIFEGRKNRKAPGWKTGECPPHPITGVFSDDNVWAIGRGTQFADMVALIAESVRAGDPPAAPGTSPSVAAGRPDDPAADMAALRARVLYALQTTYRSGRGAFRGEFLNWSFKQTTRTAARLPLLLQRPRTLKQTQLAPVQFVRLRSEALRPINTLYLDIDLINASRIDDNDKTFFAEFYLSMRANQGASIDTLEFANAFLDPKTNERQVTVRELSSGGKSTVYPEGIKIYQISGTFNFDPHFSSYPFDIQRFTIDLRPKSGDAPFIVQPPPPSARDQAVTADGWDFVEQYVGYDEDFVPAVDAETRERTVVPFYKASFVWRLKRQATDYFRRVVIPLTFILIIAYLSIFIPLAQFEAIVTIQVTALLSAVALYLALPKIDTDTTTVSDRMFLLNYTAVSLMIGISILRKNRIVAEHRWLRGSLGAIHIFGVPLLMAIAIYRESLTIT